MIARDTDDHDRFLARLLSDLAHALQNIDGEQGWLAALRFGVAGGLVEVGQADLAEPGFRRILAASPHHLWAWIGLIDVARVRGDAAAAALVGREALVLLPDEPILRRKTAEALELAEGPDAAIQVMMARDIGAPDDLAFAIELHRKAAKVSDAAPLCDRLLGARPDDRLAHLARIEVALAAGDGMRAVEAAMQALEHHPAHPEILLRAAQAHCLAGDLQRAASVAASAPEDTPFEPWLLQLRAGVAEEQGAVEDARLLWHRLHDLGLPEFEPKAQEALDRLAAAPVQDLLAEPVPAEDLCPETLSPDTDIARVFLQLDAAFKLGTPELGDELRRVIGTSDLPWYRALQLVECAWMRGSTGLAEHLSRAFDTGSWSTHDQHAFAIEDQLLRCGPRAALEWVKAHPVPRRDVEAAERLGRVLLAGGAGPLGVRYLLACCRRWPADPHVLALATRALIASGTADRVADLLVQVGPHGPADGRLASQVSAALASGRFAEGLAVCEAAEASGTTRVPLVDMMELSLLSADLAKAEAFAARLSVDDGPLAEALIMRPRATRVGTLLNEARILTASGWDGSMDHPGGLAGSAGEFFLPARARLATAALHATTPSAGSLQAVPDVIHAIWYACPGAPAELDRVLAVWRGASRRRIVLHDVRNAQGWLREKVGADAARAYAMAPELEQKADLMLLAALMVEGGMAMSEIQWPGGQVDPLIDQTGGAGFFVDGSGTVAADVVVAPPGHPVIVTAFAKAVASCLGRENDHRWFKTGAGLLTRAVAMHLEGGDDASFVTLRSLSTLRSVVHPYRAAAWPSPGPRQGS